MGKTFKHEIRSRNRRPALENIVPDGRAKVSCFSKQTHYNLLYKNTEMPLGAKKMSVAVKN